MRPHKTFPTCLAITFIGIFSLLAIPSSAQAQSSKRLVKTLEIQGNRRLRDEDIISHIKTRLGEPFSEKRIQRDLQALLELGVFDKTQTRVSTEQGLRGGVVVIFEVAELPLILEVTFKGFIGIEDSEIIKVLREKQINLSKDEVYDPVKVRAALRVVQELLASRGWSNVTVTVREEVGGTYASIEFIVGDEQQ
jgi:outer membrane protein insertion porin family